MIPRHRYLVLGLSAAIIAVVCVGCWREWTEPRFEGKRLSAWVNELPPIKSSPSWGDGPPAPNTPEMRRAAQAIIAIGPKAVPYLLADFKQAFGMMNSWTERLPNYHRFNAYRGKRTRALREKQRRLFCALCMVGTDPRPTMPEMMKWLGGGHVATNHAFVALMLMGEAKAFVKHPMFTNLIGSAVTYPFANREERGTQLRMGNMEYILRADAEP